CIEGRGHKSRLAIARHAGDADFRRIDTRIRVGFEIVDETTDAPAPGAQRSPIVGLSRLALVGQADNAFAQPTIISLNRVRHDRAVCPALVEGLLRPRLRTIRRAGLVLPRGRLFFRVRRAGSAGWSSKAELQDDRQLTCGMFGYREVGLDGDLD